MARNCPKNVTNNQAKTRETTTDKPADTTTPKLTKAQQIHALEESMAEEERAEYLDACDMG